MGALDADISSRRRDLGDLSAATTALLVIDVSNDFVAPGAPMENRSTATMLERLPELLGVCRDVGLPIVYVNHVHQRHGLDLGTLGDRFPILAEGRALRAGTAGVEIWPELAPADGDIVVEKIRQSGFMYTALEAVLRSLGVNTVIVSGITTGACVESTARDAVARDFEVVILGDGTAPTALPDLGSGAFDADIVQSVLLANFAYHFGRVASIDEVLAAVERDRALAATSTA